ncbi:MAG: helix-turn-helix domain-containing protein [Candidatus Paceibacterota bacterium]|jgi:hypothetical protein
MNESQNKQVLTWLKSGQSLTNFQAASYFSIYRLSARIYDLRKRGNNIKSELEFDGSKHWSRYFMKKSEK